MANKLPYNIYFESSWNSFGDRLNELSLPYHRICIVTDCNVASFYLEDVRNSLKDTGADIYDYILPAGEEHKTLEQIQGIYTYLVENHFDRQDLLVALGGGVVGDMTGYAAATYLRGIDFVQVPTTLLSQVDSSIGGKTGVDFACYKNLVGAFKQPRMVYMNMSVLKTLSDRQFASGMAEVIKHGCIRNVAYLAYLRDNKEALFARDLTVLTHVVSESLKIKRKIVEIDPYEKGERALLNFGHTLGHALEKETCFSLTHGEGVSLGCVAALYLSHKRGYLSKEECQQTERLFQEYGLPIRMRTMQAEAVLEAMKHDKKMDGTSIRFILLENLGHAVIDRNVSVSELNDALYYLLEDKHHEY